ncbi:hypothetical protein C8R43DRAFT_1192103 [Mycena crocata]|nr:hypothetical protein C8R43DRAFT_1192103 [Mycena crocata]
MPFITIPAAVFSFDGATCESLGNLKPRFKLQAASAASYRQQFRPSTRRLVLCPHHTLLCAHAANSEAPRTATIGASNPARRLPHTRSSSCAAPSHPTATRCIPQPRTWKHRRAHRALCMPAAASFALNAASPLLQPHRRHRGGCPEARAAPPTRTAGGSIDIASREEGAKELVDQERSFTVECKSGTGLS